MGYIAYIYVGVCVYVCVVAIGLCSCREVGEGEGGFWYIGRFVGGIRVGIAKGSRENGE